MEVLLFYSPLIISWGLQDVDDIDVATERGDLSL